MFTAVQQMLVLSQIYWVVLKESDGGTLMMFVWREILYLIYLYLREHPVFILKETPASVMETICALTRGTAAAEYGW